MKLNTNLYFQIINKLMSEGIYEFKGIKRGIELWEQRYVTDFWTSDSAEFEATGNDR